MVQTLEPEVNNQLTMVNIWDTHRRSFHFSLPGDTAYAVPVGLTPERRVSHSETVVVPNVGTIFDTFGLNPDCYEIVEVNARFTPKPNTMSGSSLGSRQIWGNTKTGIDIRLTTAGVSLTNNNGWLAPNNNHSYIVFRRLAQQEILTDIVLSPLEGEERRFPRVFQLMGTDDDSIAPASYNLIAEYTNDSMYFLDGQQTYTVAPYQQIFAGDLYVFKPAGAITMPANGYYRYAIRIPDLDARPSGSTTVQHEYYFPVLPPLTVGDNAPAFREVSLNIGEGQSMNSTPYIHKMWRGRPNSNVLDSPMERVYWCENVKGVVQIKGLPPFMKTYDFELILEDLSPP